VTVLIFYNATEVSDIHFMFRSMFPKLFSLYSAILMENTHRFYGEFSSILSMTVSIVNTVI